MQQKNLGNTEILYSISSLLQNLPQPPKWTVDLVCPASLLLVTEQSLPFGGASPPLKRLMNNAHGSGPSYDPSRPQHSTSQGDSVVSLHTVSL